MLFKVEGCGARPFNHELLLALSWEIVWTCLVVLRDVDVDFHWVNNATPVRHRRAEAEALVTDEVDLIVHPDIRRDVEARCLLADVDVRSAVITECLLEVVEELSANKCELAL